MGRLTGVECEINEIPSLKELGLYSVYAVSEDMMKISAKYDLNEEFAGEAEALRLQFIRIIHKLVSRGICAENEFDRFFIEP